MFKIVRNISSGTHLFTLRQATSNAFCDIKWRMSQPVLYRSSALNLCHPRTRNDVGLWTRHGVEAPPIVPVVQLNQNLLVRRISTSKTGWTVEMGSELPGTYKKLVVNKLTTNFQDAVSVVSVPLAQPEENEVLVKNRFVGVNASDVNMSTGRYFTTSKPPYDIGFEGVGEVVAVGKKVTSVKVGQNVAYISLKAFAEYISVPETTVYPIPELKPEYVNLLVSGLTASIGLDKSARITEGETVLVTAAAGGAGHIAVQWAKAAGCHVIGTCSSEKKTTILKGLGCDRVINYKTENLCDILKKEYPKGVDVIWETIGGSVFETCIKNLAIKGRLLIVGGISGYKTDTGIPKVDLSSLPAMLLYKSAAVQGFLLLNYDECYQTYFTYLRDRFTDGELQLLVDLGKESTGKEFVGFEGIMEAEEHLHSGKSTGKVLVRFP